MWILLIYISSGDPSAECIFRFIGLIYRDGTWLTLISKTNSRLCTQFEWKEKLEFCCVLHLFTHSKWNRKKLMLSAVDAKRHEWIPTRFACPTHLSTCMCFVWSYELYAYVTQHTIWPHSPVYTQHLHSTYGQFMHLILLHRMFECLRRKRTQVYLHR